MSQKRLSVEGKRAGWILGMMVAAGTAIAEDSWIAPAPMGPYGGHFDFGVPAEVGGDIAPVSSYAEQDAVAAAPQAEYAMYHQQEQLPVMQASYPANPGAAQVASEPRFQEDELSSIDPAWSLEEGIQSAYRPGRQFEEPLGINGMQQPVNDVWALGEISPEKLPQLLDQEALQPASAAALSTETAMVPCTVSEGADHRSLSAAEGPFQEAILDEFESSELDMEAMGREADRLSRREEYRGQRWERETPVYYPAFMPDYALGVRRANAMDPLALIPQMRSPVQYFGFQ